MANPPCPNPEIYDAGNCCGGACFEQETPEIIAAANAGTLYPPAPQAVPAEDVAALIERLREPDRLYNRGPDYEPLTVPPSDIRLEAAAALTGLSAERDDLDRRLNEEQMQTANGGEIINDLKAKLTASEAEATSLRRKLEEHRKALAEARERINRYADTAAEHDLVARIDALSE